MPRPCSPDPARPSIISFAVPHIAIHNHQALPNLGFPLGAPDLSGYYPGIIRVLFGYYSGIIRVCTRTQRVPDWGWIVRLSPSTLGYPRLRRASASGRLSQPWIGLRIGKIECDPGFWFGPPRYPGDNREQSDVRGVVGGDGGGVVEPVGSLRPRRRVLVVGGIPVDGIVVHGVLVDGGLRERERVGEREREGGGVGVGKRA